MFSAQTTHILAAPLDGWPDGLILDLPLNCLPIGTDRIGLGRLLLLLLLIFVLAENVNNRIRTMDAEARRGEAKRDLLQCFYAIACKKVIALASAVR